MCTRYAWWGWTRTAWSLFVTAGASACLVALVTYSNSTVTVLYVSCNMSSARHASVVCLVHRWAGASRGPHQPGRPITPFRRLCKSRSDQEKDRSQCLQEKWLGIHLRLASPSVPRLWRAALLNAYHDWNTISKIRTMKRKQHEIWMFLVSKTQNLKPLKREMVSNSEALFCERCG